MRKLLTFIKILAGLMLQACFLNARIDAISPAAGPPDPEILNPTIIQVSNTDVNLQEQDENILFNSQIFLTLNQKYSKQITINLTLVDIYAQQNIDYSVGDLSFTFEPGELSKSIPVLINGDLLGEGAETFKIKISLSDPEVELSANEVLVTILDNDPIILQVASLYPTMGSNFLDYVKNVRGVPLPQMPAQVFF